MSQTLLYTALLVSILTIPAATTAAQDEITWADFGKTATVCHPECVSSQWAWCFECRVVLPEGPEQCDWFPCQRCTRIENVCHNTRIPLPDGDLIDITIQRNVVPSVDSQEAIEYRLESAPSVTWWKQITLRDGTDTWRVWTEDGKSFCDWPPPVTSNCNTMGHWAAPSFSSGEFVFSKAKFLGIHTDVYILKDLGQVLRAGDRIIFRWVKD